MRFTKQAALLAVLALPLAGVGAQPATTTTGQALTLDEAIALARRNNPAFLQSSNDRQVADARVRSAYGAMLPNVSSSFSTSFEKAGTRNFSGTQLRASSDNVSSGYSIGVGYQINGATFLQPRAARANREAVDAEIEGNAEALRAQVTQQYINVLQAQARARVTDTLVLTARAQLDLAQAKVSVGAGTALDVRRAEVGLGQAQVRALTEHNNIEIEKSRLFQMMGVAPIENVALTTTFAVQRPSFALDSLLDLGRRTNPNLFALQSREKAADVNVKTQKSQYTPTLSLSTGLGGQAFEYTNPDFLITEGRLGAEQSMSQCADQNVIRQSAGLSPLDCNRFAFTDDDISRIRSQNNKFPFSFERSPFSLSARLSLPIFDNFSREQQVQEASIQRDDARLAVKARQLQLNADVTQAYHNLVTAASTVELQEQNALKAREELAFAEERYRVGATTFLDVVTSRGTFSQAQIDRINSIYDYHKAFAALENAVGRPLR